MASVQSACIKVCQLQDKSLASATDDFCIVDILDIRILNGYSEYSLELVTLLAVSSYCAVYFYCEYLLNGYCVYL